ncbi:hypothetical protein SDC9_138483 [bioreactor metagenome]|uniref:Uncharacterized protein n=1 Tax=bioreactor metagenome TaxID=1076179 RepID=A0A645DQ25_9ZZZZ
MFEHLRGNEPIARAFHDGLQFVKIQLGFIILYAKGLGCEVHLSRSNSISLTQHALHSGRACGAGHTRDLIAFLNHNISFAAASARRTGCTRFGRGIAGC